MRGSPILYYAFPQFLGVFVYTYVHCKLSLLHGVPSAAATYLRRPFTEGFLPSALPLGGFSWLMNLFISVPCIGMEGL